MSDIISEAMIYGNGFNPNKIAEDVKVAARKLVCEVYADLYTERHLKAVTDGYHDDELELELAMKALLAGAGPQWSTDISAAPHDGSPVILAFDGKTFKSRWNRNKVDPDNWSMLTHKQTPDAWMPWPEYAPHPSLISSTHSPIRQ